VRSRLVRSELRDGRVVAAVRFVNRSLEQHRRLIELMFSAPDSWNIEHGIAMDSREHATRIVQSVIRVFSERRALRRLAPRFSCDLRVVMTEPNGHDSVARATDISHAGIGIRALSEYPWSEGSETTLTVSWNEYEQTTFQASVGNVRSERGQVLLGLKFVRLNGLQEKDLLKYLYELNTVTEAERKAA
jgi:hypothetical protein